MKYSEIKHLVMFKEGTLVDKCGELRALYEQTKSKTTQHRLYQMKKEWRYVSIIKELLQSLEDIDDAEVLGDILNSNLMETFGSTRNGVQVTCKVGDKIMDLLREYSDVKDVYTKLVKYCEKNELFLNLEKGVVEGCVQE